MAFDLGAVVAHVKADVTNFRSGLNIAQKSLNGFKDGVQKLNNQLSGFTTTANVVAGSAVAGTALYLENASNSAKEYEKSLISLDIIAGRFGENQNEARQAAIDLGKELRIGTTASAEGLQNLLKNGLSLPQASELMRRFTNEAMTGKAPTIDLSTAVNNLAFAYATGNSALGNMSGISENWSDITAKGQTILEGWNGTVNESIGITQEVADQIKDYEEQLTAKGQTLDAGNAEQAKYIGLLQLTNLTMGSSERFTGTLIDKEAQLNLQMQEISVTIGKAYNLFKALFIDVIASALPSINQFVSVISNIAVLLLDLAQGKDVMMELGEAMSYFTGGNLEEGRKLANMLKNWLDRFLAFGEWVAKHKDTIITFLTGLAIGIGSLMIIGNVIALINMLMNPITLAILAITALYMAWSQNFLGLKDITNTVVNFIVSLFNEYLMPTIEALRIWWNDNQQIIMETTQALWDIIGAIFKLSFAHITIAIKLFVALAKYIWQTHGETIMSIVKSYMTYVKGFIQVIMGIIQAIIGVASGIISGDWERSWNLIKSGTQTAWNGIQNILNGALGMLLGWGQMVLDSLTKPFIDAWNTIQDLVNKIRDALDFTKRHSPSVLDLVQNGVSKVNKALSKLDYGLNVGSTFNAGALGVSTTSNPIVANININMDGAIIGDEIGALTIAEKIGDNIINRLQNNIKT